MNVINVILFCFLTTTSEISGGTVEVNNGNQVDQGCGELGDCISNTTCGNVCGCHSSAAVLFYDETLHECVVNVKKLLTSLTEKYNSQEHIYEEIDKVFKGIIFAALLFVTCAIICLLTACVYCCRINYTDTRLKDDVEALAHKLNRDPRFKKTTKKQPTQPVAESCNIVVAETGVFVV